MRALPLALLISTAAFAQGSYTSLSGAHFNNIWGASMDSTLTQMIQRSILESSLKKKYGEAGLAAKAPAPARAARVAHAALSATDFKPGPAHLMPQQFGALAGDPQAKEQLTQLCTALLDGIEAQKDFRKNNLAYGLTLLIGGSLQVMTEKEIPDAESDELVKTLNDLLATNDGLKRMSAKDKQTLYETSVIMAGLIIAIYEEGKAKDDVGQKQQAQAMARQVLTQLSGGAAAGSP
jgi:hypothetical protein